MTSPHSDRVAGPPLLSDLSLAIAFLLLVCCAASGIWLFSHQRSADAWVRHTFLVENQLSQIEIEGLKVAVNIRNGILAGPDSADVDVKTVRRNYFAHIDQLRRLTADNPSQQRRLTKLQSISIVRFDRLEQAAADVHAERIADAARVVTAPQMQAILNQVARGLDDVRSEEVRLLRERSRRSQRLENFAWWALGASLLLTLLLALVVLPERRGRIRALLATKQALQSAIEAKRSFLANMSHEIRTPMNGVLGFTELLLADDLSAEQRKHAELIDSSGRAMMRLLNDILDFSKIEAGQMRIADEPFDVSHAIEACVRLISPAASRKLLTLDCQLSPTLPKTILGDGLRLRQIVLNLLGNAVKFTEHGAIAVRASPTGSGEDLRLVLEVNDTGIGIPPDRKEAIFGEFVQADSSIAPQFGGTGLGLSITLQLVRLMGGTLELESELGEGSTFRVTLPMKASAAGCAAARQTPVFGPDAASSRGQRILLAEDHDVNQELFIGMLARLGWRAELAENGAEAVRMAEEADHTDDPFRVVLMDMQMPVMDGLEATRRIRASGIDRRRLPILALTANAYDSDVAACFAAGSQAHLAKPIQMSELDLALRTWAGAGTFAAEDSPIRASVRERYEERKLGALQALDELVRRGRFSNDDLTGVADLLHKLAGTAGMFGEPELGNQVRELEVGIGCWIGSEREAKIRAAVRAIRKTG